MQRRFALLGAIALTLIGCITTPAVVSYKGVPVNAISLVSISCSDPYVLAQDCSEWTGATLRVKLNDSTFKVAGTADGRIILAMTERTGATQYQAEQAGDAVEATAASLGAKTLKLEALAFGGAVLGYILHFDKDVYTTLKKSAVED
jgi:hypothetical protein